MTSNADRADVLARALSASINSDSDTLRACYTPDVKAWAPALTASSLDELFVELERRDNAFSDIHLDVTPLDVGGDYACAEWRVTMTHTGDLELEGGVVVPSTGLRVTLNGATVAEFRGDKICSIRQYWDELTVFEQLGLVGDPDD